MHYKERRLQSILCTERCLSSEAGLDSASFFYNGSVEPTQKEELNLHIPRSLSTGFPQILCVIGFIFLPQNKYEDQQLAHSCHYCFSFDCWITFYHTFIKRFYGFIIIAGRKGRHIQTFSYPFIPFLGNSCFAFKKPRLSLSNIQSGITNHLTDIVELCKPIGFAQYCDNGS